MSWYSHGVLPHSSTHIPEAAVVFKPDYTACQVAQHYSSSFLTSYLVSLHSAHISITFITHIARCTYTYKIAYTRSASYCTRCSNFELNPPYKKKSTTSQPHSQPCVYNRPTAAFSRSHDNRVRSLQHSVIACYSKTSRVHLLQLSFSHQYT